VVNGSIVELSLLDGGAGYSESDSISVRIEPPRDGEGGASAEAVLEQQVASIEVLDGGYGYAVDQVISIELTRADAPSKPLPSFDARAYSGGAKALLDPSDAQAVARLSPPPEESLLSFTRDRLEDSRLQGSSYSVSSELLALLPPNCRPRRVLEKKKGFYFKLLPPVSSTGLTARSLQSERAFGPLGKTPVQREREVRRRDYWAFALSGAACTATIRTTLLPIETTKVLMQVDAEEFPALLPSLRKMWATGGPSALLAGADTSALYAFVLGGVGFGANEFLRRYLSTLAGAAQPLYALQIQIASGVGAVLLSVLLVAPLEVLRIRIAQRVGESTVARLASQRERASQRVPEGARAELAGGDGGAYPIQEAPSRAAAAGLKRWDTRAGVKGNGLEALRPPVLSVPFGGGVSGTDGQWAPASDGVFAELGALYDEGGVSLLYSALLPMLLRELPFTLAKFFVFDATTDAISSSLPALQEYGGASALLAGVIAGVVSGLLTTPADTLVTRLSDARARGEEAGLIETARSILANEPAALFSGLAPRCLLFGATIGGQYLLYDFWTRLFRVNPDDLNLVLDIFADRISFLNT